MNRQGTTVDFWFDPLCPYAWITSRWIVAVERQSRARVRWHPMGLGLLNDGPGVPDTVRDILGLAKGPVRVVAAAAADHDTERVGAFYTALGTRLHSEHGVLTPIRAGFTQAPDLWREALGGLRSVITESLIDGELPAYLVEAIDDQGWDTAVLDSHARVPSGDQDLEPIGVPTLSVNGAPGRFGPVLDRVPTDGHALRLWDAFEVLATDDSCYEIKRVTTRADPSTFGQAWSPTGERSPS
ncbi:mycothiol-dependent nitroreductase Rv2466c family protein [Nocardiopsis halotolerans]|uniref:mycothiol-dependent nitroreductase Rv2466c family protein n=1 Tax=Nocardiopsis halotolerans TaxID=124252 RepID=UPI0003456A80|nr:DsbA family protein [Nocardiopsis halotolerans]